MWNNPDWRLITNPSSSAYGSTSAVAKLYGIVANSGSYEGRKLFKNLETIKTFKDILTEGEDKVVMLQLSYGRGLNIFQIPAVGFLEINS